MVVLVIVQHVAGFLGLLRYMMDMSIHPRICCSDPKASDPGRTKRVDNHFSATTMKR